MGRQTPVLLVSGGYEFLPETGKEQPAAKMKALSQAYADLNVDLGALLPGEGAAMRRAGAVLPRQWVAVAAVTQVELPLPGGGAAGFVLFPPLGPGETEAPTGLIERIGQAVETLRKKDRLVLGVSPWGYFIEQVYLRSPTSLPDVLLGSGPGPGFKGIIDDSGHCYWVRSYTQGKALNRLDVLAWPRRDGSFRWQDDVNVKTLNVGLTEQLQEDPAVSALFDGMDTE